MRPANTMLETKELTSCLRTAKKVLPKRNPFPILALAKIKISRDLLSITTTDLDLTYTAHLPIQNHGSDWQGCLSIDKLLGAIGKTSTVSLDTNIPDSLTINGVKLIAVPAQEFPTSNPVASTELARIAITPQARDILKTHPTAVYPDESRLNLHGYSFKSDHIPGLTCLETCDGHRLVRSFFFDASNSGAVILPKKFMDILISTKSFDTLFVYAASGLATSKIEALSCRAVDAVYPETDAIYPKKFSRSLTNIDRQELADMLAGVVSLAGKLKAPIVKMELTRQNTILLTYSSPEHGSFERESSVLQRTGDTLTLGFNARYILDFLESLPKEVRKVSFHANDDLGSTLWTGLGKGQNSCIIMPAKI